MIEKMVNKLSRQRLRYITIDVPDRLLGAHLFFRRMGFRATHVVRGEESDCYAMELSLERLEAARMVDWAAGGLA